MRSFSVGRRDNIPKSSVQRTFPETSTREKTISENSIKTTASESPPEQALYFEAKANAQRTYSDPNEQKLSNNKHCLICTGTLLFFPSVININIHNCSGYMSLDTCI
jgi:hypothetical protein